MRDWTRVPCIASVHVCWVTKLCLTLWDPMDCSPPGSSVHAWMSPRMNTGVGCHFLLQGIFPNPGIDPCLLHCQADSSPLNHLGSSCTARWILNHWITREVPLCAHFSNEESNVYLLGAAWRLIGMRNAEHLLQRLVLSQTVSSFSFPKVEGTGSWEISSNTDSLVGKDVWRGCFSFLGLLEQRTTNWMAQIAQLYVLNAQTTAQLYSSHMLAK